MIAVVSLPANLNRFVSSSTLFGTKLRYLHGDVYLDLYIDQLQVQLFSPVQMNLYESAEEVVSDRLSLLHQLVAFLNILLTVYPHLVYTSFCRSDIREYSC